MQQFSIYPAFKNDKTICFGTSNGRYLSNDKISLPISDLNDIKYALPAGQNSITWKLLQRFQNRKKHLQALAQGASVAGATFLNIAHNFRHFFKIP